VGDSGLEPLPYGRDLQSRCRIRTTFTSQFDYSTGIEPAPPVSTTGVVTIPLRIKLQQAFIGKLITHNRPYMDLKILAGILLATQDFVPPDRIELSPFACKTNTLPLRQGGKCSSFRAV
tara:strand:- start:48 stop:404 length:357 start_codon:yes stop_codon:yes gene_type:complete